MSAQIRARPIRKLYESCSQNTTTMTTTGYAESYLHQRRDGFTQQRQIPEALQRFAPIEHGRELYDDNVQASDTRSSMFQFIATLVDPSGWLYQFMLYIGRAADSLKRSIIGGAGNPDKDIESNKATDIEQTISSFHRKTVADETARHLQDFFLIELWKYRLVAPEHINSLTRFKKCWKEIYPDHSKDLDSRDEQLALLKTFREARKGIKKNQRLATHLLATLVVMVMPEGASRVFAYLVYCYDTPLGGGGGRSWEFAWTELAHEESTRKSFSEWMKGLVPCGRGPELSDLHSHEMEKSMNIPKTEPLKFDAEMVQIMAEKRFDAILDTESYVAGPVDHIRGGYTWTCKKHNSRSFPLAKSFRNFFLSEAGHRDASLPCDECEKIIVSHSLVFHIVQHIKDERLACLEAARANLEPHEMNAGGKFSCHFCGNPHQDNVALDIHLGKSSSCTALAKARSLAQFLKKQACTIYSTQIGDCYICHLCGDPQTSQREYMEHWVQCKPPDEGPDDLGRNAVFTALQDDAVQLGSGDGRAHGVSYGPVESDPTSAVENYIQRQQLLVSARPDSSDGSSACPQCPDLTIGKTLLHHHKKIHELAVPAWKYWTCAYCNDIYTNEADFAKHSGECEIQSLEFTARKLVNPSRPLEGLKDNDRRLYVNWSKIVDEITHLERKCPFCIPAPKLSGHSQLAEHIWQHLPTLRKRYACSFCNAEYDSKHGLILHNPGDIHNGCRIRRARLSRSQKCCTCMMFFHDKHMCPAINMLTLVAQTKAFEESLESLMKIQPSPIKIIGSSERYKCPKCLDFEIDGLASIRRHMKVHENAVPAWNYWTCRYCNDVYSGESELAEHWEVCPKKGKLAPREPSCPSRSLEDLSNSEKLEYVNWWLKIDEFTKLERDCPFCDRFKLDLKKNTHHSITTIQEHIWQHHPTVSMRVTCPSCKTPLNTTNNLRAHSKKCGRGEVKRVHSSVNIKQPDPCPDCKLVFRPGNKHQGKCPKVDIPALVAQGAGRGPENGSGYDPPTRIESGTTIWGTSGPEELGGDLGQGPKDVAGPVVQTNVQYDPLSMWTQQEYGNAALRAYPSLNEQPQSMSSQQEYGQEDPNFASASAHPYLGNFPPPDNPPSPDMYG